MTDYGTQYINELDRIKIEKDALMNKLNKLRETEKQVKLEYARWMQSRGMESQGRYKVNNLLPKPKAPRKTKREREEEKQRQMKAREEYLRHLGVNQPKAFMNELNSIK